MAIALPRRGAGLVIGLCLAAAFACCGLAAKAATLSNLVVWVPDYYGSEVVVYRFDYAVSPVRFSRDGFVVGRRNCRPNAVTVEDNLVYVVCNSDWGGADEVLVYDATTLAYVKTITGRGTDGNQYFAGASLIAAAFDKHGNLWVTAYNSNALLRVPKAYLSVAHPLVDREVTQSPGAPAGIALDTDNSFWIVGQYSGGILVNFPDGVLNQKGSFIGATALNPTPRYCISNNLAGCQPTAGLFDSPEGVAAFDGYVWVSNNGGNSPAATLVRFAKHAAAATLTPLTYGGTPGKPLSCPGGLFAVGLPGGTPTLWVNDEDWRVAGTDCGATAGDQGSNIGRVLEFLPDDLIAHRAHPTPEKFDKWWRVQTGSPGFGGIFVQME